MSFLIYLSTGYGYDHIPLQMINTEQVQKVTEAKAEELLIKMTISPEV